MRETKINREDMLELTRRMTVKRTSFTRIAGAYFDMDGEIDGTFNTNFLKLTPGEREKNLAVAKEIPFAETNRNLKRYRFSGEGKQTPMYRLLMEIRGCGLKNDAGASGSGKTTRFLSFTTATMCRRRPPIMKGFGSLRKSLNI